MSDTVRLRAQCAKCGAECNSGQRPHGSVAVTLMYRVLLVKAKKVGH